ncbi:MAG: Asp-tRNA(Asn)/Glu-tRNA(Gln) amidotransferase subunit GatB [Lentisphaerae bacterium]|nr:Asp-tRNA(Asn)/Glu-tRNA(Gln) amidotransferase subunit GatB [Lentisphaerota bacterium]
MNYKTSIGLEVHVQLKTQSKMFCGCSTRFGAEPNTQVCPVCLGYPGSLPVMNEEAVRLTVLTGLMLGCSIREYSKFDRKSYFYPDMPKNFQISQYDMPLCEGGGVDIEVDGRARSIDLVRIHLEEDTGKNTHYEGASGVDFNRAGVPLMEIVSGPSMESPEEAFAFLQSLKEILLYVGVSDCNLEEGKMRCDVNCSVRPEDRKELGTKTEIKNRNTFKEVLQALRHEEKRQVHVIEGGGAVVQETLRWDVDAGVTISMRQKEYAHDYRYFPEPDLAPVVLARSTIEEWRSSLPESPRTRRARMMKEYGIPEYDAGVISADREIADYFEAAARLSDNPKAVSNWIMTELLRLITESGRTIKGVYVTPKALSDLIGLVEAKKINTTTAKEIFSELFAEGGDPRAMVEERGLAQVSDTGLIDEFVEQAMSENPKSVEDYRRGKTAAAKFLVGQVMRLSRGKADPQVAAKALGAKLDVEGESRDD